MRFLFLDTETGGLNAATDSLLTVGIIAVLDGMIRETMHIRIQAECYFTGEEALAINKIHMEEHAACALSRKEAAQVITNFIQRNFPEKPATVVGHNVAFDLGFLNELFFSTGLKIPYGHRTMDTAGNAIFMKSLGIETGTNLPSLLKYYKIPYTDDIMHDALTDARLTMEVFLLQHFHMAQLLGCHTGLILGPCKPILQV